MTEQLKKDLAVALASKSGDESTAKELIDIIEQLVADVEELKEAAEEPVEE